MAIETMETAVDDQEFARAEQEAEHSTEVYVHTFRTPFTYCGKTYDKLTFHFGKLTGADSLAVEDELQLLGKAVIVPVFSGQYLTRIAARACQEKLDVLAFKSMPIKDYNQIRSYVRSFFLASELSSATAESG